MCNSVNIQFLQTWDEVWSLLWAHWNWTTSFLCHFFAVWRWHYSKFCRLVEIFCSCWLCSSVPRKTVRSNHRGCRGGWAVLLLGILPPFQMEQLHLCLPFIGSYMYDFWRRLLGWRNGKKENHLNRTFVRV